MPGWVFDAEPEAPRIPKLLVESKAAGGFSLAPSDGERGFLAMLRLSKTVLDPPL